MGINLREKQVKGMGACGVTGQKESKKCKKCFLYPDMCDSVKYNKICEIIYENKWIRCFYTIAGAAIVAIPSLVYIGFTLLAFLYSK